MKTILDRTDLHLFSNRYESLLSDHKMSLHLGTSPLGVAAAALLHLWRDLGFEGTPLLFRGKDRGFHRHYQPELLNQFIAQGQQRDQVAFGQLTRWECLSSPAYAFGVAQTPFAGPLLAPSFEEVASVYDRGAILAGCCGWYRYDFADWTALSVMLEPDGDDVAATLTAVPSGRQDEWLSFLGWLRNLYYSLLHEKRKGKIEVIGEGGSVTEVIGRTTFQDVILPEEVLQQVAAQRRIFTPGMLERYTSFGVPRIRKVLLIGPPGTGKTTLLKAEAAYHAQQGGYVIYVFAAQRGGQSWERLSRALLSAEASRLPTMILVEDFEEFVSGPEEPQRVLNMLDGITTPDNPAGTLLLGTSNAPEKIDARIKDRPGRIDVLIEVGPVEREDLVVCFLRRFLGAAYCEKEHAPLASEFLKQPGSHLREVCLLGAIHSLDGNRTTVLQEDLLWAHETILNGRAVAAEPERFTPVSPNTTVVSMVE